MRTLVIIFFVLVSNLVFASSRKEVVSVYELKVAITDLINRYYDLEEKVNALYNTALKNSGELTQIKTELQRLKTGLTIILKSLPRIATVSVQEAKLYTRPNGKVLDTLPYGTRIVVFFQDGNFCYTNGGVINCSELSFTVEGEKYGNQILPNR
jgi:predicted outer membrane repeat protein